MNCNPNISESVSQCAMLTGRLIEGETITSLEAMMKYGIGRLASRIYDIKPMLASRGYELVKEWKNITKANGRNAKVMMYYVRPINK